MNHFSPTTLGTQVKRISVGGFNITEAYNAPLAVLPAHAHELACITFVLNGFCEETFGRSRKAMDRYSIITKPAGTEHSNRYGKTGARCLIVEAQPQKLASLRPYSRSLDKISLLSGGNLPKLAIRLYHECWVGDSAAALGIEGLVLELIGQVTRMTETPESLPPAWLRRVRIICDERFRESMGLLAIAEEVGVHPAHLARAFRKHYQCTVGEYVRRARFSYAAQQLAGTDRSLVDISAEAGFYDQSHFTHAFKLATGLTPSQYRSTTRQ